ncbi:unnamed protein product [Paramecium octaurelia]|uniref:Oxidoreductase FAD/NAD(P)-binding domain-containing protein n=1 Tax=Paramecium octaurelia TaxID=43137 RepID=A0A8S1V7V1_PAROT|nr:unnamed protein product [Paramecium octaurelia]
MGCGQSSASFFESRVLIYIYYGTTSGNSSRMAFQWQQLIQVNLNLIKEVLRNWLCFLSPLMELDLAPQILRSLILGFFQKREKMMNSRTCLTQYSPLGILIMKIIVNLGLNQKKDWRNLERKGSLLRKRKCSQNTIENDYQTWISTGVEETLIKTYPAQTCDPKSLNNQFKRSNTQMNLKIIIVKLYLIQQIYTIPSLQMKQENQRSDQHWETQLYLLNFLLIILTMLLQVIQPSIQRTQNINELCNQLRFDKNMKFEVITTMKHPFPNPISIYNYLKKYCDFTGLITKQQLMELSNQEKREKIYQLLSKNKQTLDFFTIASSSMKHPKTFIFQQVNLFCMKKGLDFAVNIFEIQKRVLDSKFAFTKNPKAPMLLLGPGSGLAPMRVLIQERDYYFESNNLEQSPFQGNMELLFGCRTEDEYFFEEELKHYEKNCTLSNLKVAFSRKAVKQCVTDIMDLHQIHSHLQMEGIIYICGSAQMGRDITNKIQDMFKQIENIAPYLAFKKLVSWNRSISQLQNYGDDIDLQQCLNRQNCCNYM